ncbi:hypothetical protein ZWY2020_032009 [Hordeum vulgare]|nr:hypothetical protein ZWY2020_032009 [Hordeum vulgare]
MASAPQRTASTHRSVVVRGTHQFHIVGYSERKLSDDAPSSSYLYASARFRDPFIKSAAFQVGNYTWHLVCSFGDRGQGHLASITLELLTKDIAKDVVATASLQIDDPLGQLPPAVWRSAAANRFCKKMAGMSWTMSLPDVFSGHEERYVSGDDDSLTILCTIDILQEDAQTTAETRECLVSVVPKPTIPRDLQRLLLLLDKYPKSSDATFLVGDTEFHAHRLVLAMRSPVFATELTVTTGDVTGSTTHPIRIQDMDASTFRAMLWFIYTDEIPIDVALDNFKGEHMARGRESMARKLLVAADRYHLERLRLMCENILSECIDVTTVMKTLLLVRGRERCSQLEDSCIKYISSHPDVYNAVRATKDYEELKETCSSIIIEVNERVATHNMARHTSHPSSLSSTRPPAPEKSTSSYNLLDVVRGTHEFRIPIFSSLQSSYRAGQIITSDIFKVGGYEWKINVYPSGNDVDEHISVYLCLCTDPGTARVKTSKRFRVDDPNGKSPSMVLGSQDTFTKLHESWGFQKFITVDSAKSRYIGYDGSLTIHCDIDVHKEACTTIPKPMIVVPPSNIAWHLEQLMMSGLWSNMTFLVEESEIHAHWLIIAVRSPVLFETVAVETCNWVVRINGMKADVLRAVLHFVYTDELLPVDDAVAAGEMLAAACRFRLERMRAMCENLLAHLISKDNVLMVLELAWRHQCEDLKLYCLDFTSLAMK